LLWRIADAWRGNLFGGNDSAASPRFAKGRKVMNPLRLPSPCIAAAVLVLCMNAFPAHASLVSVTGGFTSFSGPVESASNPSLSLNVQTLVNSIEVTAQSAISGFEDEFTAPGQGIGLGSITFASPQSSVEFWISVNGVDEGLRNLISFTPGPAVDVTVGAEFLLGTFTITNGTFLGGRGNHALGFTLTTVSTDPALDGHTFTDSLSFVITLYANNNTPEQNADYFFFSGNPGLGTMRAYELFDSPTGSNTGTIELYGKIGSLIPTRLDNAKGGVFFNSSTGPIPSNQVPLPGTLLLVAASLAALRFARRAWA
jgi:hypothetical protein